MKPVDSSTIRKIFITKRDLFDGMNCLKIKRPLYKTKLSSIETLGPGTISSANYELQIVHISRSLNKRSSDSSA